MTNLFDHYHGVAFSENLNELELSTESIDNRLCDEEVQNSAYASRGTKAKQKTLSSKVYQTCLNCDMTKRKS